MKISKLATLDERHIVLLADCQANYLKTKKLQSNPGCLPPSRVQEQDQGCTKAINKFFVNEARCNTDVCNTFPDFDAIDGEVRHFRMEEAKER